MNKLKELRKERNLTQKELSVETGIPYRTIQRWEHGETTIKQDKAQELADYFGVSVGYLLGFTDWSETFQEKEFLDPDDIAKIGFDKLILHSRYTDKDDFMKSLVNASWVTEVFAIPFAFAESEEEKTAIKDTANHSLVKYIKNLSTALYYLDDYEVELLTRVVFLSQKDKEQILNIVNTFTPLNEE
ncbi:TPA: helix-turn-helix domain-containing protein [Streptococcus suis]